MANLTRGDVIKALSNSLGLSAEEIGSFLDKEYPRVFFPLLSIKEFQELKRKLIVKIP